MFDKDLFKNIMSQGSALVYVVTTNGEAGKYGLTINTLSSVTDNPSMILFCVNKKSSIYNSIEKNKFICVNFLSYKQQDLAHEFSGNINYNREDRFKKNNFNLTENNQIYFKDSLAFLEGDVEDEIVKGTHSVFFVRVMNGMILRYDNPLIYWNRSFRNLI